MDPLTSLDRGCQAAERLYYHNNANLEYYNRQIFEDQRRQQKADSRAVTGAVAAGSIALALLVSSVSSVASKRSQRSVPNSSSAQDLAAQRDAELLAQQEQERVEKLEQDRLKNVLGRNSLFGEAEPIPTTAESRDTTDQRLIGFPIFEATRLQLTNCCGERGATCCTFQVYAVLVYLTFGVVLAIDICACLCANTTSAVGTAAGNARIRGQNRARQQALERVPFADRLAAKLKEKSRVVAFASMDGAAKVYTFPANLNRMPSPSDMKYEFDLADLTARLDYNKVMVALNGDWIDERGARNLHGRDVEIKLMLCDMEGTSSIGSTKRLDSDLAQNSDLGQLLGYMKLSREVAFTPDSFIFLQVSREGCGVTAASLSFTESCSVQSPLSIESPEPGRWLQGEQSESTTQEQTHTQKEGKPQTGRGNKTAAERIQEVNALHDQGLITEAEAQQQRQSIIQSI